MHPSRRRKKRPNYGIRTVEVMRGPNGFGFTISGQQPCILSCIVNNSPAEQAGLRAGDFLISVNGVSVSKKAHDAVVSLIGSCVGPIEMTIAENYYSDSSDEDLGCSRMGNGRKPKYMHKPRGRVNKVDLNKVTMDMNENSSFQIGESVLKQDSNEPQIVCNKSGPVEFLNITNSISMDEEAGPLEYKVLVGYLGTIEMPEQLLPNSRLQTVCSCIRKLRQEKRNPTAVLMTVLPTCLTLKNACNNILAIYPSNRVVYVGSTADRESRYFGLVTSALSDRLNENFDKCCEGKVCEPVEKKINNFDNNIAISNSCHIFVTDPKIVDHNLHQKKAESFKITCTTNMINGNCLEFPSSSSYIVRIIQSMYKLQNADKNNENVGPIVANSPQPSASSNSDSGIGFRDDCGNISDRILVVEFPVHRPLQTSNFNKRPSGIHASNVPLEYLDKPLNSDQLHSFEINNSHHSNVISNSQSMNNNDYSILNNLNNVRACEHNMKQEIEKGDFKNAKYDNIHQPDNICRLTCRAIPDFSVNNVNPGPSSLSIRSSDDNTHIPDLGKEFYSERPVDVPLSNPNQHTESRNGSVDTISVHSSKSCEFSNLLSVFKAPFESKKARKNIKIMSSLDNLDKCGESSMNYKMSPRVCHLPKINYSCEDFNNFDSIDKYGYGSLQDLWSLNGPHLDLKNIAQSEPDVRISRNIENNLFDQNGFAKCSSPEGPTAWAHSFEKLLEDPLGLHMFTESLKKQFSAENIYFWTACERFRLLPPGAERQAEAQRIYQLHLGVGAAEPVNVDAQGRHLAEHSLSAADHGLFEQAQKQIFVLMKLDCYPRFLKSDIYKRCVAGEIEKWPLDTRLVFHQSHSTPSKLLKKSVSNAEGRRKSLLPWHRKNRSKSKDRGESEYSQKSDIITSENNNVADSTRGDLQSSGSSLTSLDLAISNQELDKPRHCCQEDLASNNDRIALCRVILSNGSTTVTQIRDSETIQDLVNRILDKRGIAYSSFEVFTNKHPKCMDVNESSSKLAGCEVTVEQRVVFKLDLPNRKTINIRSKYTKIIVDVLRPSLHKYQYNLDEVFILNGNVAIDLDVPVTTIDGLRLKVQLREDTRQGNMHFPENCNNNSKVTKLEEITNQVFEGILQDKCDSAHKPTKSDKGSIKSEDWGSEHSSTFIGKFLRRDSGMLDRKKKMSTKCKPTFYPEDNGDDHSQLKKPLIAKMKQGANKLHLSDELVEGLTRAQRRIEDQRGTEINFELPDFLKDKENEEISNKTEQNTQFGMNHQEPKNTSVTTTKKPNPGIQFNYENRNVLVPTKYLTTHETEIIKGRMTSPFKSSEESSSSNQSTPAKAGSLNATVIENKRQNDPPPLPPKPKIVPIKPQNWGQVSNVYKHKEVPTSERSQGLFLERTSSSFV
ncbi:unnamed protein product [Phaedon cochleariae]|uniref:Regulator of G-protein signaling loco n=1 Tax=Phaedon cochleariae TaxID=80249 RepID=A0A9P0DJT4_PHACE|nr:unnamed protein product [Phaedon cochleariae]